MGRTRAGEGRAARTPRRPAGDHWGELQSVVISAALIASAFVVDGRYNIDRLELAATVLIPVGLLGSCVAKQAMDRREGRRPAPAPARRPRPPAQATKLYRHLTF